MPIEADLLSKLEDGRYTESELEIDDTTLTHAELGSLLQDISKNRNIKKLGLVSNNMNDSDVLFLMELISSLELKLELLDLSGNNITGKGLACLYKGNFKELVLTGNHIDDKSIAKHFTDVDTGEVESLNIMGCDITGEGMGILFSNCGEKLKRITAGGCFKLGDKGWDCLSRTQITHLLVSQAAITDSGANLIAEHGGRLQYIDLTGNFITGSGIDAIVKGAHSLREISANGISVADKELDSILSKKNISVTLNNNRLLSQSGVQRVNRHNAQIILSDRRDDVNKENKQADDELTDDKRKKKRPRC